MDKPLLLNHFSLATGIQLSEFRDKELLRSYSSRRDFNLPLYLASCLPSELPALWVSSTPEHLLFGGVQFRSTSSWLLVGPVLPVSCTKAHALQLIRRLGRKESDAAELQTELNRFPLWDMHHLEHSLRFLYELVNGDCDTPLEILEFHWTSFFQDPYSEPLDIGSPEPPGDMEDIILSMIRHGKEQDLIHYFNENILISFAQSGMSDLKRVQTYILGANMLMSRCALDSGVDKALINELAGFYYDRISEETGFENLSHLFYTAALTYTRLVGEVNAFHTDSSLANQIAGYIRARVYERLTLSALAADLNYSAPYLSSEFKKATGKAITEYIRECKIKEAAYLLEQRIMTPTEVSDALGFSSPGYFGKVFRKEKGCAPSEWRKSPEAAQGDIPGL